MENAEVDMLWWRNVQPGEFYNIERTMSKPGGGGARYIEIPKSMVKNTLTFLGYDSSKEGEFSQSLSIDAHVMSDPQVTAKLEFKPKTSGRLRISNQNRHSEATMRHPAWTKRYGFPEAPDSVGSPEEVRAYYPEGGLRVYVVHTTNGEYYAGYTKGKRPNGIDMDDVNARLYDENEPGGFCRFRGGTIVDDADRILKSLAQERNVLLYGPPGTGKTRIISELYRELQRLGESSEVATIGSGSTMALPINCDRAEIPIPMPAKAIWTTFHQSYTYEDFVLGLRPSTENGSLGLKPWAGVLLDSALELHEGQSDFKSVVIFIDEINRGNAARIFGEFMTFLDFDYREGGCFPLPIPLRQLNYVDGLSEEIYRPNGGVSRIKADFCFPKNIYIIATMNSVDRAAVPIDSALARRFDRISLRPSGAILANYWDIDLPLGKKSANEYSAKECAFAIFNYLNDAIASDLGPEFELGHGLFMGLQPDSDDEQSWREFAGVWDEIIFPQLEDRFMGRDEVLCDLLKVDERPLDGEYAWKPRNGSTTFGGIRALVPVDLSSLDCETIKRSFRWLAR